MKLFHPVVNRIHYTTSSKLLVAALFAVFTLTSVSGSLLTSQAPARAATCNPNDIIPCGATSPSGFVSKYKQNPTGDLAAIYQSYGLAPNEIDRFARTAQMGVAHKDGTITVGGKVVATNADSLGREKKAHSQTVSIGGKTYYSDTNQNAFLSNELPALVMMNGEQFEFAALTACGNPLHGNPTGKAPIYSCNMLTAKQINRTTFSYTTDTTALHGAKIAKLTYDFGDGTSKTTANPSEAVTHSYAREGVYTTKVTVYVAVNGETKAVTGAQCAKPVEVKSIPPTPAYTCDALTATTINQQQRQYRFAARTSQSGGATLIDASFNFGDNQSVNNVKPSDANTVSAEHTYARAGTYTIVATVTFSIGGKVNSVTCQTMITPTEQPPTECKPNIPVGDSRCTEAPAKLPETGVVDVVGSALGTTGVVGAGSYFYRSRRNLLRTFWRS